MSRSYRCAHAIGTFQNAYDVTCEWESKLSYSYRTFRKPLHFGNVLADRILQIEKRDSLHKKFLLLKIHHRKWVENKDPKAKIWIIPGGWKFDSVGVIQDFSDWIMQVLTCFVCYHRLKILRLHENFQHRKYFLDVHLSY